VTEPQYPDHRSNPQPAVTDSREYIICEYCDSVYRWPGYLDHREKASCRECGATLFKPGWLTLDQRFALAMTALVLLFCVIFAPILDINAGGQLRSVSLVGSAAALVEGEIGLMAIVVGLMLIFVPAAQTVLLAWLLAYARKGRQAPGFSHCLVIMNHLAPWSMLEVMLLAILVSIVKLTGPIHVQPDIGFAAMILLAVLLLGLATRDVRFHWATLR